MHIPDQVAWSRGDRGFFAITVPDQPLDRVIYTGLPPGTYCDVTTGCPTDTGCSEHGQVVVVRSDRRAKITIRNKQVPTLALHVGQSSLHTMIQVFSLFIF